MPYGANVPLGYDVKDRKLLVNKAEAETVRHIYRRYAELGSVRTLKESLDRDGIVSKVRVDRFGRTTGGQASLTPVPALQAPVCRRPVPEPLPPGGKECPRFWSWRRDDG